MIFFYLLKLRFLKNKWSDLKMTNLKKNNKLKLTFTLLTWNGKKLLLVSLYTAFIDWYLSTNQLVQELKIDQWRCISLNNTIIISLNSFPKSKHAYCPNCKLTVLLVQNREGLFRSRENQSWKPWSAKIQESGTVKHLMQRSVKHIKSNWHLKSYRPMASRHYYSKESLLPSKSSISLQLCQTLQVFGIAWEVVGRRPQENCRVHTWGR